MRILIIFGSTEGHTRHLAGFMRERLTGAGHDVETAEAGQGAPSPEAFDRVILAGSLHVGRYQAALVDYARRWHGALAARPSAFVSVSLSAAGENPDDWAGLEECLAKFVHETQWTPTATHQAAGAIRYSQYDFFKRLTMKTIAAKRGRQTVTSQDYDLTDYAALGAFVDEFVGRPAAAG